jgi:hypothetical protein
MCPHSSELAKATASPLETSDIIIVDNKECRRGNQKRTARETIGYTRGRKTKQKHNTLLYYSTFIVPKEPTIFRGNAEENSWYRGDN